MAPPSYSKVLVLYILSLLYTSMIFSVSPEPHQLQTQNSRRLLDLPDEDDQPKKNSATSSSTNTQVKLMKPNQSAKNQTKLLTKSTLSAKNQTKLSKSTNSTKSKSPTILSKSQLKKLHSTSLLKLNKFNSTSLLKLKKLNSTSLLKLKKLNSTTSLLKLKKLNSTSKSTNSTKSSSFSSKKSSDLLKLSPPKNKTTKSTPTKLTKSPAEKKQNSPESSKPKKTQNTDKNPNPEKTQKQKPSQQQPSWIDQDEDDSLVLEFRDLPNKFQKTLIPDLERISTTSKAYITKYNRQITNQFKPIVGNRHAPTIAIIVYCAFIFIPLLLVSLVFNQIKAYLSLQKVLIFIQVYLSIYFSILCLSSLVTGLEPLRFFYAASRSTYVGVQVLQTLAYVLYLLLLLMYLVLVFSNKCGLSSKLLGLGQTFVGFAVGLHYYVAVFHRVVLRQPPKTKWEIHGIYATCFLVVSLCANAERKKKAYLEENGDEGKMN